MFQRRRSTREIITREFSAKKIVRQASTSSWKSFKTALSSQTSKEEKKEQINPRSVNIEIVRSLVLHEINENPENFHPKDIQMVKTNNAFIERFFEDENSDDWQAIKSDISKSELSDNEYAKHLELLKNEHLQLERISSSVIDCFKWRKEVNVNEFRAEDFPREFYDMSIFTLGKLDEETLMLYITARRFRKLDGFSDLLLEFMLYMYEAQAAVLNEATKIIVLSDTSNLSIAQVDLPLFLRFIPIYLKYYPGLVKQNYVLELSWMYKPFVKIVFALLPNKYRALCQFIWKSDFGTKFSTDKIPDFMGGPVSTYKVTPPENCESLLEIARQRNISDSVTRKALRIISDVMKDVHNDELIREKGRRESWITYGKPES